MSLQKKKNKRILITGGHSTPAAACINELKNRGLENIVYVGQKKSILFDKNVSSEYRNITQKLKIPFYPIIAGKLSLYFSFSSLIWLLRFPIGFIHALFLILRLKPNLILTFGSHIGVPIVFWGYIFRIPIIAHEQTTSIGKSNRFIQKFATKICMSWPNEISDFEIKDNSKSILTGNPIRKEILKYDKSKINFDFTNSSKPILFITGGNQGAHSLNEFIFQNIEILTKKYNVIHQTGSNSIFDDFGNSQNFQKKLNTEKTVYISQDYIFGDEMAEALHRADIIISRAGANTLIELVILNKKSLLVPIPTTSGNEQFLNAKFVSTLGLANVVNQDDLQNIDIEQTLSEIINLKTDESERIKFASLHLDAEKKIVDIIEKLIN